MKIFKEDADFIELDKMWVRLKELNAKKRKRYLEHMHAEIEKMGNRMESFELIDSNDLFEDILKIKAKSVYRAQLWPENKFSMTIGIETATVEFCDRKVEIEVYHWGLKHIDTDGYLVKDGKVYPYHKKGLKYFITIDGTDVDIRDLWVDNIYLNSEFSVTTTSIGDLKHHEVEYPIGITTYASGSVDDAIKNIIKKMEGI